MLPMCSGKPRSTVIELWTDRKFELWIDDTLFERKANPYGFIPFVIYPNLREPKKFWGVSEESPTSRRSWSQRGS